VSGAVENDRLSVIDEMFLRTHRGFGVPIVLQGIWRSDDLIERVELSAVHANLAHGRLGRRVVTPRIPCARRRWTTSSAALPLALEERPLTEAGLLDWADSQGEIDIDPEFGPGWRLSAAPVDTGGTVVSLVCSHALADAGGLIAAAGRAFEGAAPPRISARKRSDLGDAVSLTARVAASSLRATAGLAFSRRSRREMKHYLHAAGRPEPHDVRISTAVFEIDAHISNPEFIALVADIAAELGEPHPISVNVPFRSSAPGANGIGMATIEVSQSDSPAEIKSACKSAFARPAGAPSGFPAEMVQLLPEAIAASMTLSPGTARVLCSNIGPLPNSIRRIGDHPASALATRAIHPHSDRARTVTALSAYISSMDGRSTLSLVGTDDHLIASSEVLRDCTHAVLARRELGARSWR